MPAYTVQGNLKTARKQASDNLSLLFQHLEALGIDLTDVSITKTGGNQGAVTVTTTQSLPPEQLAHLGLA